MNSPVNFIEFFIRKIKIRTYWVKSKFNFDRNIEDSETFSNNIKNWSEILVY